MKKIINGKRYDTDTAKRIGAIQYGTPGSFEYWHESLYLKKTGEYFLYGRGGPLSKYGCHGGDGDEFIPLTESEARAWAEENLDGDDYEAIFGPVEEDVNQTLIKLGQKIRKLRESAGLTQAEAAARVGCSQQLWAEYEAGQVSPTVGRLLEIADALGVKASELLEN